jgi:hypothetical protein
MKSLSTTWILCSCLFALPGCATKVTYVPLGSPPHPMAARPVDQVDTFTSSKPTKPFVEVGQLHATQDGPAPHVEEILQGLREEAARRGCDGVLITGTDKMASGDLLVSEAVYSITGTCIVYP